MAERSNAAVLKTVDCNRSGGSNPSLSASKEFINELLFLFMVKSSFSFQDVFEVAKLIPYGRVTSYGAIAAYLGLKSGARMVGWAMNQAHGDASIPAHRVLNRHGLLTGKAHFSTPTAMQEALEAEGLIVQNNQVVNFEHYFWDPCVELA
jgi:methylated-DNA-protein-cysteine methyltransferase-like protein